MAGLGDILGNIAKLAGKAAVDSTIGSKNRAAISSLGQDIFGRGSSSSSQRKAQSTNPTFKSAGGSLPPNASLSQILMDTNRIDRDTLQAVRLQTAKMDEINDTLDGVKYGIENLEKQVIRNEERRARAQSAANAAAMKSSAGSSKSILDLLMGGGEGLLAGLGLKKTASALKGKKPKLKAPEPDARSRLIEPELADTAIAETAEKGVVEGVEEGVAGTIAKKSASRVVAEAIPILGDVLIGALHAYESGSVGEGIAAGFGSFGGRIVGAAGGTLAAGPAGTVVGEMGGAIVGSESAAALYHNLFNRAPSASGQVIDKSKLIDANSLSITARDMVFEAEKFDFKVPGLSVANGGGNYGGEVSDDSVTRSEATTGGAGGVGSGFRIGGQDTVPGDVVAQSAPTSGTLVSQMTKGGEGGVGSGFRVGGQDFAAGDVTNSNAKLNGVSDGVKSLYEKVSSSFGGAISISSGKRDEGSNARAGGAKNSAHLRGNALDAHFAADIPSTLKFIKLASEAGAGGIGVYRPGSVHIDVEGRRGWGPSYHKESIPDWAKDIMDAHMSGTMSSYKLAGTAATTGSDISDKSKTVAQNAENNAAPAVSPQPSGGGASSDRSSSGPSIQAGAVPDARPPVSYRELYDHHETDRR
jgi:hypothetical protein